jgi:hypothetical protein
LSISTRRKRCSRGFIRPRIKGSKSWFRNFGQDDKWNFCLTTGTLVPANQERA